MLRYALDLLPPRQPRHFAAGTETLWGRLSVPDSPNPGRMQEIRLLETSDSEGNTASIVYRTGATVWHPVPRSLPNDGKALVDSPIPLPFKLCTAQSASLFSPLLFHMPVHIPHLVAGISQSAPAVRLSRLGLP